MKKLPEKIVIIGGDVMAAEFAYIFSMFGSKVTILSEECLFKKYRKYPFKALAMRKLQKWIYGKIRFSQ